VSGTPQIELRDIAETDARAYLELLLRNRAFLRPFEPARSDSWFSLESVSADLARAVEDRRSDRGYAFGIWERDTNAIVGRVALSTVVRGAWQNANLGYFVDQARNARGYATFAVREALAFAFGWADLHRVQAAAMPRNAGSIRVLEKNGFRQEGMALEYLQIDGRWEDHLIHAITRDEWSRRTIGR